MTYRPHLDGIRAIAVMAVVLYHANVPGLPGGFVGVDVFFVISGYLITGLLLRELETTGSISLVNFVERRVRRLAPALFVVVLATLVAAMIWLSPIGGEQQGVAKSAIAVVLLWANVYFWQHTGGYFDAPTDSFPLLHTWTLSVEEQFYLLWPLLLLAAGWWARRRGLVPARAVLGLLLAIFACSLAACIWFTWSQPQAAFFLMPFRAWEFAAGGATVLLLRWQREPGLVSETIAMSGLLAVLASIVGLSHDLVFPGWLALFPVLGAAALIYGSEVNPQGPTAKLLALKPMVFLGLISYSLYLWHWPMLSIVGTVAADGPDLQRGIALCAIAVALAWLTFRYVEQPIRKKRAAIMASQARTLAMGASMMACLFCLAAGLGVWAKFVWPRLPANAEQVASYAGLSGAELDCKSSRVIWQPDGRQGGCVLGDRSRPVKILLWGDSHAGHLKPIGEALAQDWGASTILRHMLSCPPVLDLVLKDRADFDSARCVEFNREVFADLRARTTIDLVILSARWVNYAGGKDGVPHLSAALQRTVAQIEALGARVVVLGPGAEFRYRVPECLRRRSELECELPIVEAERRRATAMAAFSGLAGTPKLIVIDPFQYLCDETRCNVRQGINPLYIDSNHLSTTGARKLVSAFVAAGRKLVPLAQRQMRSYELEASRSGAALESPSD